MVVTVLAVLLPAGALSQRAPQRVPAPANKAAAPVRDLSGTWMPSNWYHQMAGGDPGNLPRNDPTQNRATLLTAWGQDRLKSWTPESDPDSRCLSPGAVRS